MTTDPKSAVPEEQAWDIANKFRGDVRGYLSPDEQLLLCEQYLFRVRELSDCRAELEHALDLGDQLADWINNHGAPAIKELMDAYERRIRSDCTLEQLEKKPWECREWIIGKDAIAAKPVAVVEIESRLAAHAEREGAVCSRCKGSGEIEVVDGVGDEGWLRTVECPNCKGTGVILAPSPAGPDALAEGLAAILRSTRKNQWLREDEYNTIQQAMLALRSRPAQGDSRDAERYRWLRSSPMREGHALVTIEMLDWNEDGPTDAWYDYQGKELDAAIDAAMSQQEKRDG